MSTDNKVKDPQRCTLQTVRLAYCNLFRPRSSEEGKDPKFSVACIINKITGVQNIEAAKKCIQAAATKQWGAAIPKGLPHPLRDGGDPKVEDKPGYGGEVMFINASSNQDRPPQIVDLDPTKKVAELDRKIYSGCYANVVVRFWAQDKPGTQGGKRINCGLEIVQFVEHGESLGGGAPNPQDILDDLSNGAGGEAKSATSLFD